MIRKLKSKWTDFWEMLLGHQEAPKVQELPETEITCTSADSDYDRLPYVKYQSPHLNCRCMPVKSFSIDFDGKGNIKKEVEFMEERFKTVGISSKFAYVRDELNQCPICKDAFVYSVKEANEIAKWLNKNVNEYKRFELQENRTCEGIKIYLIYDNEKEEDVKFKPLIMDSYNHKKKLEEYVDWLNELVEAKDEL